MAQVQPANIEVYYEKSNFFRVIHADGIFGGPTPSGNMHVAFFSQRSPLPKKSSLNIGSDGSSTETVTDTKTGVFREIEVDVMMDLNTSLAFHIWFSQHLSVLRKQLGMSDQDWSNHIGILNAAAAT